MRPLSTHIADGTQSTGVVFGIDGRPAPLGELLAAGSALYSDDAGSDAVGALLTNDRATVEIVLGALVAGTTLVSLPLPGRGADPTTYMAFLQEACAQHGVREVVVSDEYADLLALGGVAVRRHSETAQAPLAARSASGFRLVQFTSGTTGRPRSVVMDDRRLGANLAAILERVQPQSNEVVVTWLPLSHDMGLVGMLLAGIAGTGRSYATGGTIVVLDPRIFLRSPAIWVTAMDRWGGTFTAAPDFAFRLAAQRPPRGDVDLSRLRCAIAGGEIVRPSTLRSFTAAFGPRGLGESALCPAYGLAEVGLAVTISSPRETWRSHRLSAAGLADHDLRTPGLGEDTTELVACGRPLESYEVEAGSIDRAGEIHIRGPSVGRDASGLPLAKDDGWFAPGDVGFVVDRQLYVCGRSDDYLTARGKNVYAPAVEAAVGEVDGVRTGRTAAVGLSSGDWVVAVECGPRLRDNEAEAGRLRRAIQKAAVSVASAKPDTVILVARGGLPLTTSGKLQRNKVRAMVEKGELSDGYS